MNVIIEDQSKKQKKLKILYISIISICVVAIISAFIIQIVKERQLNEEEKKGNTVELPELTEEKISAYKEQFNDIFENKVNYLENNAYKISKVKQEEEIVYLRYQNNDSKENYYELDVNIPYINIKNETIEEFNKQIQDIFEKKAKDVLNTKNKNVIYTVDYSAYVANNILSVVVRSTLKEGANPQRDIIQTYNYDLISQNKCSIDKMIEIKGITKKDANQKINNEIKTIQNRV